MTFQGEHLLSGFAGKSAIFLALVFAMASAIIYLIYFFKKEENQHLLKFSRILYYTHFFLILIACVVLYYIIYNHYFEYNYVWKHSSTNTPVAYIISCFWAGQEGSFLIWLLFQGFLGIMLIKRSKALEPVAMAVIAFIQFLLILNVLGISVFGYQVGASPFFLLRDVTVDPLFNNPSYLSLLSDGSGLNPLLQNPWMVIHPPLIFFGYALAIIPYALIIAALAKKQYEETIKPLIYWTVIALFFLGIGIILGGAWAYEALTFGGFWSWDPVENATLVPWIVLLATLHFLLIYKRKNFLLIPALGFSVLSYIFVVYASFLTRSGILANTSAHSFGNEGFQYQIVVLLVLLLLLPVILLIRRRKSLFRKDSSTLFSTEFLMYIGSILLLLSAFQIIFTTSIPVINSIFSMQLTPPGNRELFYNSWQIPFAAGIFLLITFSYVLFNKTKIKSLILPFALSIITGFIIIYFLKTDNVRYIALYFSSLLCLFFTIDYLIRFWIKTANKAAALTHLGFGIFIFGALLTFSNQHIITSDSKSKFMKRDPMKGETVMLLKDRMLKAGNYYLLYDKKEKKHNAVYFNISFFEKYNDDSLKFLFNVNPVIKLNSNMGNVYEPYIKKFFGKDIFTYITYVDKENIDSKINYKLKDSINLRMKDTIRYSNTYLLFDSIIVDGNTKNEIIDNLRITARIQIGNSKGDNYYFYPVYIIKNGNIIYKDAISEEVGVKLRFKDVGVERNTINLEIYEKVSDVIIMKIILFPYINLLWIGVFVMLSGFGLSVLKRRKYN